MIKFEIEISREDLDTIKKKYGYDDDAGAIDWALYRSTDYDINPKVIVVGDKT